ncbi:MAG: hypothetical protein M5U01_17890 [Ardenticatenaceae bacterium]|nr:hypothetical protein [Ardenticatenaceae bacterium]
MTSSLRQRIHTLIRQTLDSGPGAWMVWCDPRGHWSPLLRRVAGDEATGDFPLLAVDEETAGEVGGPQLRRELQARLDAGESFVLLVPVPLTGSAGSGHRRSWPSASTRARFASNF